MRGIFRYFGYGDEEDNIEINSLVNVEDEGDTRYHVKISRSFTKIWRDNICMRRFKRNRDIVRPKRFQVLVDVDGLHFMFLEDYNEREVAVNKVKETCRACDIVEVDHTENGMTYRTVWSYDDTGKLIDCSVKCR